MEKQNQPQEQRPKSNTSRWILFGCGGCGCLIIIIIIVIIVLRSLGSFAGMGFLSGLNNQSPSVEDEEDRTMTKSELIDYFIEETTTYSSTDIPTKVARWDKDLVTVSIADAPPEGGVEVIDNFITIFNRNSTQTKLERASQDGDIKIYFQADAGGAAGRSGPSTGADFTIDEADIRLSDEAAIFEQSLASVLSHEMMHALGFTGHYSGSTCRLMSPKTCGSRLTGNEEKLIQMLYSSGLPAGAGATEIRGYFENRSI